MKMNKKIVLCVLSIMWVTCLMGQNLDKFKDKVVIAYQVKEYEHCLDYCEQFINTSSTNDPEIVKIMQACIDTLSMRRIAEAKDSASILNFPKALKILMDIDKRFSNYQSLSPQIDLYSHYIKEQRDGKMVSAPLAIALKKYDSIDSFHDGWALVSKKKQDGYGHNHISSLGKEIEKYNSYSSYTRPFSDGYSVYGDGSISSIMDVNGVYLNPWDIGIENPWDFDAFSDFEEGFIRIRKKKNGKWGYVAKNSFKIPCKYDKAWPFHDGLALVFKGGHCYFIDTSGKRYSKNIKLMGPRHWPIAYYSEDLVWLWDELENNLYHVAMDKLGNYRIKIPHIFEYNGTRGLVELIHPFNNGLSRVELNKLTKDDKICYGFINKEGQVVIDFIYGDAKDFKDNLCAVKYASQWGYINTNGEIVIPFKYDYADTFSEGLALVKDNGKWGFVNYLGEEVISIQYDLAFPFSGGFAVVKKNGRYGLVDKYGFCTLDYPF